MSIFEDTKMPAAYPVELRQRAVQHYRETQATQEETAEIFKIGVATLRLYLRLDECNQLRPKLYKRGRARIISGKKLEQVKKWVEEKPDIQLKQLVKKIKSRYKKQVSFSMMSRALTELNLRRKKKSHFAQEQLREDVKKSAEHI